MRAVDPAGQAILESGRIPIAFGARITRRDGQIFRMLSFDQDLTLDVGFGPELYRGIIGPDISAMENTADFKADNLEISGFLYSLGVTEADIRDGRFDGADIRIFYVFWENLTISAVKYNRYTIGDGSTLELGYQMELRSLVDYLNARLYTNESIWCNTTFMSPRCGVVRDPSVWQPSMGYANANPRNAGKRDHVKPSVFNDRYFRLKTAGTSGATEPAWNLTIGGDTADGSCVWTTERARLVPATIATVIDRRTFTIDPVTDAPDGLLVQGLVKATSGLNDGSSSKEIDQWTLSTNQVELVEGFTQDPQIGDTIEITLSCSKTIDQATLNCQFYANIERMVAWPHKPGDHALLNPGVA